MQKTPSDFLKDQFDMLTSIFRNSLILDSVEPIHLKNIFTFKNDTPIFDDRSPISGKFFNHCSQYLALFKSRSFHFLMKDGSIVKFHYEFDDKLKLVCYNLLWFPFPFSNEYLDMFVNSETNEIDKMELYNFIDNLEENDNFSYSDFNLRTPIRIDYDYSYKSVNDRGLYHPISHIHLQHSNTRARNNDIFCLYKFFTFIIENCYPDYNYETRDNFFVSSKELKESSHWLKCNKPTNEEHGIRIYTTHSLAYPI